MGAIIPWTDEQKLELTHLFTTLFEGAYLSHRAIGARIGKGRNAVIGQVHRLKLFRDPLMPCRGVDNQIAPQQRKIPMSSVPAAYGRHGPPRPARRVRPTDEAPPVRSPHAIQILEATDKTCKFPIGHVGHEGFHLCGDVVGTKAPYCEYHGRICYYPPKRRDERPSYRNKY